jgi:hypothetical protein
MRRSIPIYSVTTPPIINVGKVAGRSGYSGFVSACHYD